MYQVVKSRLASFLYKSFFNKKKLDFIIIGAQKCGTTALFDYLDMHPYCMGTTYKEPKLFTSTFKNKVGCDELRPWFMRRKWFKQFHKVLFFEATPDYVYQEEVPERIYQHNSNARLIFLVREPVSRAISEYNMACWYAREWNLCVREDPFKDYFEHLKQPEQYTFSWFIEEELRRINETNSILPSAFNYPDFIRHGLYSEQLKRYYKYFKPEQILIIEDAQLKKQKKKTLRLIEDFLDIPHIEWDEDKLANSNIGIYNLPVSEDCKQFLRQYFTPWNQEFFHMIGRDMDW